MAQVTHVTHSLKIGGAEQVIATLCRLGDRVVSIEDGPLRAVLEEKGVIVSVVGSLRAIFAASKDSAEIVAHNLYNWLWVVLPATWHSWQGRIVLYQHSPPALNWKTKLLMRLMWGQTDHVICVSQEVKNILRRCGMPDKLGEVKRNLIDFARFKKKETYEITGKPTVGTVGRLVKVKNHALLLEAMQNIDARLVIVGDGPEMGSLTKLAHALKIDVHFMGERHDIPSILSTFDVFVLSSDSEGQPVAILEAMATGLPIVSTEVGAIREMVGPYARLVSPGKSARLADAINYYLHNRDEALADGQTLRDMAKSYSI